MTTVKLSKLKPNPSNPRFIRDAAFERLCDTLGKYPHFLSKRPIIIDSWDNPVIIAGNMRHKALKKLGHKEIPSEWVKEAKDLSEDEKRAFMVLDNTSAGEWQFEELANNWDIPELESLGVFIPNLNDPNEPPDDYDEDFEGSGSGMRDEKSLVTRKLLFTTEEDIFLETHIYEHGVSIEQAIINLLKKANDAKASL